MIHRRKVVVGLVASSSLISPILRHGPVWAQTGEERTRAVIRFRGKRTVKAGTIAFDQEAGTAQIDVESDGKRRTLGAEFDPARLETFVEATAGVSRYPVEVSVGGRTFTGHGQSPADATRWTLEDDDVEAEAIGPGGVAVVAILAGLAAVAILNAGKGGSVSATGPGGVTFEATIGSGADDSDNDDDRDENDDDDTSGGDDGGGSGDDGGDSD